jgi:hypothetical protein
MVEQTARILPGQQQGGATMAGYHCYFLDVDGHIEARDDFDADTDEDAIILALARYAKRPAWNGLELWRGKDVIYKKPRERN